MGRFATIATVCLAATTTISAFPSPSLKNRQDDCSAVHIFIAKGWNETYPGRQGKLTGAICYGLDSCSYEDVLFSNTPEDDYCGSVTEGAINGVAQITAYAERCPQSQLVVSGYSQGANVAGDILGGGGGPFGTPPLNCSVGYTDGLDPTTSPGNQSKSIGCFNASSELELSTLLITNISSWRRASLWRQSSCC